MNHILTTVFCFCLSIMYSAIIKIIKWKYTFSQTRQFRDEVWEHDKHIKQSMWRNGNCMLWCRSTLDHLSQKSHSHGSIMSLIIPTVYSITFSKVWNLTKLFTYLAWYDEFCIELWNKQFHFIQPCDPWSIAFLWLAL